MLADDVQGSAVPVRPPQKHLHLDEHLEYRKRKAVFCGVRIISTWGIHPYPAVL